MVTVGFPGHLVGGRQIERIGERHHPGSHHVNLGRAFLDRGSGNGLEVAGETRRDRVLRGDQLTAPSGDGPSAWKVRTHRPGTVASFNVSVSLCDPGPRRILHPLTFSVGDRYVG